MEEDGGGWRRRRERRGILPFYPVTRTGR